MSNVSPSPVPSDSVLLERRKRRNSRNLAVFFVLLGFVLLVYAVTIIKIKLGYGP